MKSSIKFRAGFIGFALTFFLLLQLLSKYPVAVEKYYSNGLYPLLTRFMTGFSSKFPFSISELVLWLIIVFGIPFIIIRIKKKRLHITQILLNLLITGAVFYMWFYIFWGINYFRVPLKSKLKMDNVQLQMDIFDSTFVRIIQKSNDLNIAYPIRETDEINEAIETSYEKVLQELGLPLVPGYKGMKTLLGNWLLNKTTTTGFFSPFFHEAHYNRELLIFEQPFVIAHEKAHQMGYTSETEANFLAFLVCIKSDDQLLRYSGYFNLLGYFRSYIIGNQEKYEFFQNLISKGVKLDWDAYVRRWTSHQGWFSELSQKAYDLYLKANQVKEGSKSYSRVVDLVLRYFVQKEFP